MSKKSTKIEELVELLQDEKATELIVGRLEQSESFIPAIEDMIGKKIDKIFDKILAKLDPIIDKKVNDLLQHHLVNITSEHEHLKEENAQLRARVSHLETEARLSNLILHGVEEIHDGTESRESAEKEALEATLNLCNQTLSLNISSEDISLAFRIPKKGKEKYRPIVVKFATQRTRNLIYRSRTKLRKTSIFINEHLTTTNAQIYAKARAWVKEGKIVATWTAGGLVFIQLTETPGCKPTKITSLQEMQAMMQTPPHK